MAEELNETYGDQDFAEENFQKKGRPRRPNSPTGRVLAEDLIDWKVFRPLVLRAICENPGIMKNKLHHKISQPCQGDSLGKCLDDLVAAGEIVKKVTVQPDGKGQRWTYYPSVANEKPIAVCMEVPEEALPMTGAAGGSHDDGFKIRALPGRGKQMPVNWSQVGGNLGAEMKRIRFAMITCVTEEDLRGMYDRLIELTKHSNPQVGLSAIHLAMTYLVGKPPAAVEVAKNVLEIKMTSEEIKAKLKSLGYEADF